MDYSLKRIAQIFEQKQDIQLEQQFRQLEALKKEQDHQHTQSASNSHGLLPKKTSLEKRENNLSEVAKLEQHLERTLELLLRPEYENSNTPYELLKEYRQQQRKRKQQTHSPHL